MPKTETELLKQATESVNTCLSYRNPWLIKRREIEDMYYGRTRPALKGRFNIPVPILEGFVNTLESKIDDQIRIEFKRGREATLKSAKKMTAAWLKDSSADRGDYNGADLDAKKLAIFSSFGVLKLVPSSYPEYRQELMAVDYYDFIFEPNGGANIEKHIFKGQLNIFKSEAELKEGVKRGLYSADGVSRLLLSNDNDIKVVEADRDAKYNRFLAMGLNPKDFAYVGDKVFNLTELVMKVNGGDWYILFDYKKQIIVRSEPLKKIFSSGLSPWVVWHTERNPVSFITRAPVDSVYPMAEAMRILINQNFDNIQKRNWDMVLYNAKKILNPKEFEYRPNGLIRVKLEQGESIDTAYRKMETPDTSGITINLLEFFNNFLGEKTGVTPGASGVSEETKVGIYYGNLQQVADRFGLLNKFYVQAHTEIAKRYKYNLKDHLPSKGFMVQFVGLGGYQSEALTKEDLDDDFSINVVSANQEAKIDEITKKNQKESLLLVVKDQELRSGYNQEWLRKEVLRTGDYSEEEIREAMMKDEGGDAELMSEAARSIEDLLANKKVKLNQSANPAFIRKVANYAIENADELSDEEFAKLYKYAIDHLPIAEKNAKLLAEALPPAIQPEGNSPALPMPANPANPEAMPIK